MCVRLPPLRSPQVPLVLALWIATCTPHPSRSDQPGQQVHGQPGIGLVPLPRSQHRRSLRGDWESPATLLVAYEDYWKETLAELVTFARLETEVVVIINPDEASAPAVRDWVRTTEVRSLVVEHDTPWIRDYGPFELRDEEGTRWIDMDYNRDRPLDDALPESLGAFAGVPVEHEHLFLDGGALISNGRGHCAMTDASLAELAGARTLEGATATMADLGCQLLTVTPALADEETGHIDIVAQFLAPDVVAVAEMDGDVRSRESADLDRTAELLEMGAEQLGQKLSVVRVPLSVKEGRYYSYINGTRLPESFLVPAYRAVPRRIEELAHERLREGLLGRVELISISADDLVKRGGAIHCVTLGLNTALERRTSAKGPVPQSTAGSMH